MSVEGVELPNSEPSSPLSLSCGSTPCKELPPIDYYTIAIMSDSPTDNSDTAFTSFANPNYLMSAGDGVTGGDMSTDDAINSNISYCDNDLYDNPDTGSANLEKSRKKYAQLDIAAMGMEPTTGDTPNDNVTSPASSDAMTADSAITSPADDDASPTYSDANKTGFMGYYASLEESANMRHSEGADQGDGVRTDSEGSASVMNKQHVQLSDDKRLFINSPDSNDSGIQADVPHVRAPETEDLYAVVTKEKGKADDREEEEEEEDDDERTSRLAREALEQQEAQQQQQVEPEPAEELPPGWEKHEDEKGAYYFHVKSGTTQYEPPSPDFDKQQRAQSSNENLTAPMPSSSPVTTNGGTSDSEQHLQEFEGHAVKYVEHSLRAMAPPKETRSQPGAGDQQPVRFSVRSLGWVGIAEEDLTPERSSKAVNRCIVDLSLGRNYINDVVGRWGEGKDLLMDLDDHHLVLINPQDMTVLHVQPIHSIRVWGVGRDNGRDFAFVARDSRTRQHLCHVFRCDMPARRIANTLRDICRKLLVDRTMHQPQGGAAVARPQNLPNLERCDQPSGQVTFESLMKNTSFPTPMEEPKKVLRCHYLGTAQVPNATGVDIANSAMQKVYAGVPPEKWLFVSVAVAPSTITITEHGKPDNVLAECRVRFLSFLGIAMKNAKLCSFIMHTAQNHFIAHVFHCEPSAGQLCKTIEAACKLRYQKCLDSHQKEPPEQKPHSDPRPAKSLGSTLKAGMQNVFGKFKKSS